MVFHFQTKHRFGFLSSVQFENKFTFSDICDSQVMLLIGLVFRPVFTVRLIETGDWSIKESFSANDPPPHTHKKKYTKKKTPRKSPVSISLNISYS